MNRQSFDTTKTNGRKHFQKLLDTLLDYNQDFENRDFNDIHIYQEESFIVIEWKRTSIEDYGAGFEYLDYNESIYSEVRLPNDTYVDVPKGEEDATLKEWLKEHPEWQMTSYGTWTNEEENKKFRETLGLEETK